jgi:hypothetical protein
LRQQASEAISWSRVFAFVAALSIAFLTAFNLGARSNDTRNAWRLLNTAVLRFNQGIVQKDEVITAYEKGETLIGGISFSQVKTEEGSATVAEKGQTNEGTSSSPDN